jgi:hypothetical protein
MPPIREKKNQPTWVEHGLPDLRSLERELRSAAIEEIDAATDHQAAIELMAQHLGFIDPAVISIDVVTPMGLVTIHRGSIYHIVEKRSDARERCFVTAKEKGRFFRTALKNLLDIHMHTLKQGCGGLTLR